MSERRSASLSVSGGRFHGSFVPASSSEYRLALATAGLLLGDAAPEGGRWPDALLGSFAMHIGGGTDEVQRNIIGEVVLGLPREPQ